MKRLAGVLIVYFLFLFLFLENFPSFLRIFSRFSRMPTASSSLHLPSR
jgi:hypothetical protein